MFSLLVRKLFNKSKTVSGFTLIELLAVIVIAGILAAISAQSFEALQNTRRINAAQGELFNAIKEAQSRAKKDKISYQVSIRRNPTGNGEIQLAVHYAKTISGDYFDKIIPISERPWRPIISDIRDSQRIKVGLSKNLGSSGIPTIGGIPVICVRFKSDGTVDTKEPCINGNGSDYLVVKGEKSSGPNTRFRCLRITSLLGTITSLKEGEASCDEADDGYL